MATFKREIKKLPSEQNLRLLSSLVISLANKTSSVEDKCITPWKAGETYQKDVSFVVYNRYIYFCSVTNNDDTFTESHWTKLADNFDELSVEDVKAFLNLTPEQLQTLSSIISDTEVRLDKTYSSSKIYTDIKQCLDDSKAYTLAELGKASGASYKVVSSTGEMTEQKYIYLMSDDSGSYNLYIVEDDGNTVQIGNTTINLSDYYTKTEVDNDFLKKTDATSTYATITTVDGKVDKADIATTIDSSSTNDTVTGTKAIYDYILANTDKFDTRGYAGDLDDVPFTISNATHCYLIYNSSCTNIPNNLTGTLYNTYFGDAAWATQLFIGLEGSIYTRNKANGTWSSWERYLRTADITTTIDSASTNDKVPSAKAIYNKSKNKTTDLPNGTDIIAYADSISNETVADTVRIMNSPNSPYGAAGSDFHYTIYNITDDGYKRIVAYDIRKNDMYMIMKHSGTWGTWRKVCTTSVADSSGTATINNGATGTVSYKVKNGVCYVSVHGLADGLSGVQACTITGLPKASVYVNTSIENLGNTVGTIYSDDGITFTVHKVSTTAGYGMLSYPVAES